MKLFAATALASLLTFPAMAQNCAPRDAAIVNLAAKYGETRQTIGLGSGGSVVEMFANTESGGWTVLVTRPDGISCIAVHGQSFAIVSDPPTPEGDPT